MTPLYTYFVYAFSCSTLLVYGLGLEKAYQDSRSPRLFLSRIPLLAMQLALAIPLCRFIFDKLLIPNSLAPIIPLTAVFICALIQMLLENLRPGTEPADTGERIFFFGTAYLALSEGSGYVGSIMIALGSLTAFMVLTFLLVAIKDRIASARIAEDWRGAPIVLVSLGLLTILLYSADVAWWFQGVAP